MISTRKNGGFSIAMSVYQGVSVAITLLSAYQVLFWIYPTTVITNQSDLAANSGFLHCRTIKHTKIRRNGKQNYTNKKTLPPKKFGSPSPHKKNTCSTQTNNFSKSPCSRFSWPLLQSARNSTSPSSAAVMALEGNQGGKNLSRVLGGSSHLVVSDPYLQDI